jgi:hypothetical protein
MKRKNAIVLGVHTEEWKKRNEVCFSVLWYKESKTSWEMSSRIFVSNSRSSPGYFNRNTHSALLLDCINTRKWVHGRHMDCIATALSWWVSGFKVTQNWLPQKFLFCFHQCLSWLLEKRKSFMGKAWRWYILLLFSPSVRIHKHGCT